MLILALRPSPVRTACLMHSSLITGSMPGIAASTSETCELGSPPNAVEAPEKSFDCEVTWAWISMPITTSHSPAAPLISLDFISAASVDISPQDRLPLDRAPRNSSRLLKTSARCHKAAAIPAGAGTRNRHRRWPYVQIIGVVMNDNRAPIGTLGAILGALMALA